MVLGAAAPLSRWCFVARSGSLLASLSVGVLSLWRLSLVLCSVGGSCLISVSGFLVRLSCLPFPLPVRFAVGSVWSWVLFLPLVRSLGFALAADLNVMLVADLLLLFLCRPFFCGAASHRFLLVGFCRPPLWSACPRLCSRGVLVGIAGDILLPPRDFACASWVLARVGVCPWVGVLGSFLLGCLAVRRCPILPALRSILLLRLGTLLRVIRG